MATTPKTRPKASDAGSAGSTRKPATLAKPAAPKTTPAARKRAAAPTARKPAAAPTPAAKPPAVKASAKVAPAPAAAVSSTPAKKQALARKAAPMLQAEVLAPAKPATKKTSLKQAAAKSVVSAAGPAKKALAKKAAARPVQAKPVPADDGIASPPPVRSRAVDKPVAETTATAAGRAAKTKPRPASALAPQLAQQLAPAGDTAQAVLAVLAAAEPPVEHVLAAPAGGRPRAQGNARQRPPRRPAASAARQDLAATTPSPGPVQAAAPPVAPPTGPAHSAIVLVDGPQRRLAWQPGYACPPALLQAARQRLDEHQHLAPDDDAALPTLGRLAAEAGHVLRIDDAVWPHLAAHRDARTRLAMLEAAYPQGPACAGLRELLRSPLPLYQAEGALFAVVAGRALIADERGLGKGVQAIAAAALWRRHFGVSRVLVLCAPAQRAAWQRAWRRFDSVAAVDPAQVMDGGLHQRQALWSTEVGVRILSPEALASDAAHVQRWAPDLIIVDEPQQLDLRADDWAALQSPHALVLCGAPLAEQPALMEAIVGWLDEQRLGPLAALRELQSASERDLALSEADIERLTASLSRLMLQRLRDDLHDQLPALVHTERLLTLAPGQREAHDLQLGLARRLLAGWRHSGYLSDADQWRLARALRAARWACQRADPADPTSALADATVQAMAAQLALWQASAALQVAVLCASAADRDQLAARLNAPPGVHLLLPADALPAGLDAVLQAGVPWRTRRVPAGPRGSAAPGQQWLYLVAQDSLEAGLFDTLALRTDAPRGLLDGGGGGGDSGAGGRAYLQGERLADWLGAIQAAIDALTPGLPPMVPHA